MGQLRRPLIINFLSNSSATLAQFGVSIVLARLLTPGDIGVFSITVVFVNIAHIFRDFGVVTFLQREPDLTAAKIRSAIGVLFTASWVIALGLFIASGWIAEWFYQPQIVPVMHVLAGGFLFIPFGAVTNALLTREYAADKQAIVNVVSTVAYVVTCLGLAYSGFGTMSLAWANLANILTCALALVPFRPKYAPWLPSFKNWHKVLHFGAGTLLSNCVVAINNAIPDILLGKLGSAHDVGLLSRANSTVTIFTYVAGSTVNYGSVTYFSSAYHQGKPLPPLVAHATALITGVGWSALALTALLSKEIVLTLYGPAWVDCLPAIPALALAAAIALSFNYLPAVLNAIGRPYLSAVPIVVALVVRILIGWVVFDGSLKAFAWAICLASMAMVPVMFAQQRRLFGFKPMAMVTALLPSASVAVCCVVTATALKWMLPSTLAAPAVLGCLCLPVAMVWYGALRMTKHPLLPEVHHIAQAVWGRIKKS